MRLSLGSSGSAEPQGPVKTIAITTQNQTQHLVAFQQVITQDGRQVLIPVQTQVG